MKLKNVPVLIVGAGYAGLTAALLLSLRGVPCLLVERRAALSDHPRAHGVNLRSMELLRQAPGLERDLNLVARASPTDVTTIIAETVSGPPVKTIASPGGFDTRPISPATMCTAGQDRVEPVLLRHARSHGADIRFSTELLDFSQSERGVRVTLRDESGLETRVEADYLIAADGSGSGVRKALGVAMNGREGISHAVSILFEADLTRAMAGRGFLLCYLRNSHFTGAFVSCDEANRGQLNVEFNPNHESASHYSQARCVDLVRRALGEADCEVNILSVLPWRMSALLVERMRMGRVFLAGDAAHIMPPVGGLAGQAAIQDSADLAWKLAMVIKGQAEPALLNTYDLERLSAAQLSISRAMENYVERLRQDRADLSDQRGRVNYLDVAMSYRYRSPAISLEEPDDGRPIDDTMRPSGLPGTRLAHVPLFRKGARISTHDLVGAGFVLLAGPSGGDWSQAARTVSERSAVPLTAFQIGADVFDEEGAFLARTGLCPQGALLVRPDGFIAWRSVSGQIDPTGVVAAAIARATCAVSPG